ncbi:DUF6134 family protein [Hyphomicrobium sp. 2TAF46]|uniref:DUF6134 family protein n=1 Tax=Hyphomicrobium sp. 2TAF46 TaxID=3233019 RepID=UPI003F9216CA
MTIEASPPIASSSMDRLLKRAALTSVHPASRRAFKAFRNGSHVGHHELSFAARDGSLRVDVAVEFAVKLGPLTMFRYALRGHEIWTDGRLAQAHMRADNNGSRESMSARRDGNDLLVEGTRCRPTRFSRIASLATHWNITQLNGPMLHPQNGALLKYDVHTHDRDEPLTVAGGHRVARRYSLRGRTPIDLWYDQCENWVGLKAKAVDGSLITYFLITS